MSDTTVKAPSSTKDERIKVGIRLRPLLDDEDDSSSNTTRRRGWKIDGDGSSITSTAPHKKNNNAPSSFVFDQTFDEKSTTTDVYNSLASDIVQDVMRGLNGTIFAYGQTGSGKTHTMEGGGRRRRNGKEEEGGEEEDEEEEGIVQMAIRDVFNYIAYNSERVYLLRVSVVEIYNEEVRDLLDDGKKLKIREDVVGKRGVFVNSKEVIVTDLENTIDVLEEGVKRRVVRKNGVNESSSRSHAIFRFTLESRHNRSKRHGNATEDGDDGDDEDDMSHNEDVGVADEDDDDAILISTLSLVDLAGSESARYTNAMGDSALVKEGGKINQSLLTLSQVISSLSHASSKTNGSTSPRVHINYRDSKLTRLLQPYLSGNSRMAIVCCISPSVKYMEETKSTLAFATRAKFAKTRPRTNQVSAARDDASLIKKLQKDLNDMKQIGMDKEQMEKQFRELEAEAANAEIAARLAEEKLKRVQGFLWRGSVLLHGTKNKGGTSSIGASDGVAGVVNHHGVGVFGGGGNDARHHHHHGRGGGRRPMLQRSQSAYVYNDGQNRFTVANRRIKEGGCFAAAPQELRQRQRRRHESVLVVMQEEEGDVVVVDQYDKKRPVTSPEITQRRFSSLVGGGQRKTDPAKEDERVVTKSSQTQSNDIVKDLNGELDKMGRRLTDTLLFVPRHSKKCLPTATTPSNPDYDKPSPLLRNSTSTSSDSTQQQHQPPRRKSDNNNKNNNNRNNNNNKNKNRNKNNNRNKNKNKNTNNNNINNKR
mmetsp:Transcript_35120/g.42980  ORF Transcript_35120/g.42980 Transcript_35120/m.42980 type:complete len:762 (-) Transcript_35120:21-2306(-)